MCNLREIIENHNEAYNLRFDKENHEYSIQDNIKLQSVTSKISQFFPFNKNKISREVALRNWQLQEEVLDEWEILKLNGSYIHELADTYCRGKSLPEKELQLLSHLIQFFKENNHLQIICSEIQVFSKKYNIAGTIDLIVKDTNNNNRLYIIDWKTSKKRIDKKQIFSMAKPPFEELPNNKFHIYSMQLSCYSLILKQEYNIDIWDYMIVHLKYDDTYEIIDATNLCFEAEELLLK